MLEVLDALAPIMVPSMEEEGVEVIMLLLLLEVEVVEVEVEVGVELVELCREVWVGGEKKLGYDKSSFVGGNGENVR